MNPKHKLLKILFGPIMNFFEQRLKISGMFVIVILFIIGFPFLLKNKSKDKNAIVAKIVYCLVFIGGLIAAIKYTIDLRRLL